MGAEYVSSNNGESISVTGDLSIREFEGGFTPDGIWIGSHDISQIIATLFGLELSERGSLGNRELGKVKLTIEKLKD